MIDPLVCLLLIHLLQALVAVLLIGGVLYGMACEMAGRAVFWPDHDEMRPE